MADSVPEPISNAEKNLHVRFADMDLNSEPAPSDQATIEGKVFYNDEGLVLENLGFDSMVVLDNLPIVRHEKARELESGLRELLGRCGSIKSEGFSMPVDIKTLDTRGYCFVEFETRQEAEVAVKNLDGKKYADYCLSVMFFEDSHMPEDTIFKTESCKLNEMVMYDDRSDTDSSNWSDSSADEFVDAVS